MASPSRPRPRPPLLQPTEHYDVPTGKLCAPPSTVDESDFYVRRRGGEGAQGEEEGGRGGKAGVEGGRSGSNGFDWKDKEKDKKTGLLPLVVRYLPLDLWFCTSVLKDSTIDEIRFHLLSLSGLIPPQPYRHDLVPSFDSLPKIPAKSVFELLSRNPPKGSVLVSESFGEGGSSRKSASLAGNGRPKNSEVAGLGGGKGKEKEKEKESGWNKFQHIIKPSISSSNLRSTFSSSSSSAAHNNSLASTPTSSSTPALVPHPPPPCSYAHPALPSPLHPHPSSSSISLPSSPTAIPSNSTSTNPAPSSSATTTSSLLSDLSLACSSDGGEAAAGDQSWSLVGYPSPPQTSHPRSRTDSQAASVLSLALSTVESSPSSSSLPLKVKFAPAPAPPGIVVEKSISPSFEGGSFAGGGGTGKGTTTATSSSSTTRKGKVVLSAAAATRSYHLDHETERVLKGYDLVCFGTGFLLDKFSLKNLRAGEIVEIQLRDSYLPLPRSNPDLYLRPCFQSWVFLSSVVGGSTKHSSSSGGAGRENESLTFKRRWLKVEGGEVKGWKSVEEGVHSSVPVVHYPISALISLDEYDAPRVNSRSLQTIPAKSILARFSERTEGGVKVETGRIWIRSQSQRAHDSLLRCLTFASPWSARTQLHLSPNFDRRLVYLEARNILTQPSWRLRKAGYFDEVEARPPKELMEWETWVFTRFDWNASGESSARNSISHGHAPGTNASRTRTLDGTAEEYPDNVAPKLSAAPLGTRRPTTKSITSSTASLSLSRTISNLEMTSTTSLTSLSSSTTKAKQSFPSVIAEAFSGIVLATATLGRSRSSSSANGKGHRRSLTASSSHEVFSTTDRKNILEPRSPLPIKTGVDSSGEQVFLIGGDGTETDPGPIEETAAQWSRRMGSKDQEGEGAATIKSRASSQAERRKTTPPGTHHSSTTLGEVSAAEETNHRRRQTVTASHFQSPTPFSRSSFASVKTVSSVASTSTTSLDTPRDFNPQPRPSSSSSSSASQGLPKKTPSPTPSVKSKNSSSPPQPPPPRSSSIPIPSIPQHRRHDSSTLQSILSTSPRSFTSHNVHSSPSARSLASSASTSSTPNRKTLLPLLPPSAYTPPSILSPSLVPPLIPKRVDSYPISDSPRGDVSFGAAILTGGPSRMSSVEDLGFIESSRSSASSSASAARRGRRQSEGSSSNSSSNGRRKFVAAAEEEKASLEGSGEGGRVEGEGFALMGSSKGRLMKERSLSRKKSLGEGGGGIRRKAVDYGPLMGEL